MMPVPNTLYEAPSLQRRRLASHLSQPKLAQLSQVNRQTISNLEQGKRARPTTLERLATVLCCTVDDLISA